MFDRLFGCCIPKKELKITEVEQQDKEDPSFNKSVQAMAKIRETMEELQVK